MKKLIFLLAAAAFCINCGAPAANVNVNVNKSAANTNAAPAKSATPANTNTSESNSTASSKEPASNEELDFTLINKTGYDIKSVYVGPSDTKNWEPEMEVLHGRNMADGASLDLKFHPKLTAKKWDIKVEWADGSGSEEWYDADLTTIEKITLKYDKATDKTSAIAE